MANPKSKVLVADDDAGARKFLERLLTQKGFDVVAVEDGEQARQRLLEGGIDAVLSDIGMPRLSGIQLLEFVNANDLGIPVVLITGSDSAETAKAAVNGMAVGYLNKPAENSVVIEKVEKAVRLRAATLDKARAVAIVREYEARQSEGQKLEQSFNNAMATLWMAYQPIVSFSAQKVVAYEALVRNEDTALRSPPTLFSAADKLNKTRDLSRQIRQSVAREIGGIPGDVGVFINLTPQDLEDEEFYSPDSFLAPHAQRIVLEITERDNVAKIKGLTERVKKLRDMGFRLAVDDYGAGHSGLIAVFALEPEIIKLDRELIQGYASNEQQRRAVERNCESFREEFNSQILAEGIETAAERDASLSIGVDLLQGYYFGRPEQIPRPPDRSKYER